MNEGGRPKLYQTKEEAAEAARRQNRESRRWRVKRQCKAPEAFGLSFSFYHPQPADLRPTTKGRLATSGIRVDPSL